ncbi:MAG: hypothetical protein GX358_11110 [candidate division WS1 bacterium]|nr:hypothetical protein [candidate division WS1 bacterium]
MSADCSSLAGCGPDLLLMALRVTRVSAGWLPLPTSLHGGVADTLTGVINDALELNNVTLSRIEVVRGLMRATATVQPMNKS